MATSQQKVRSKQGSWSDPGQVDGVGWQCFHSNHHQSWDPSLPGQPLPLCKPLERTCNQLCNVYILCLCVCWQPTLQITQIRHMHCIYAVCAHFTKTQKDMHTQIDTDTETQIQRQTPLLKVLSCLYFLTDNYKRHGRTLCFTHADKPVQLIW